MLKITAACGGGGGGGAPDGSEAHLEEAEHLFLTRAPSTRVCSV